jgi:cell fate regulator YaaT (PSP1 superfamily)
VCRDESADDEDSSNDIEVLDDLSAIADAESLQWMQAAYSARGGECDAAEASDGPEIARVIVNILGVRFGYAGRVYHFDAGDLDLALSDWVLVKTEKGLGLGQVAVAPAEREISPSQLEGLRKVIRKATKADFDQKIRCARREKEAYTYCQDMIETLGLPMKLVTTECFFDGSKYVFYFTAEGRVDFRELVKLLVARFPVRIEMRQIGVRHEAKMTGGLACCGEELCCSRFLTDFRPVSVKMAKTQNLSLNPTKISGVCGRLMCCLAYEYDIYDEFRKGLPKVGKKVNTSKGEGVVLKHDPLTETILVKIDEETTLELTKEQLLAEEPPPPPRKSKKKS